MTSDEVVPASASPAQATPATTDLAITVGATARVVGTDGVPLRARATPSREAPILARFEEDTVVEVIDGPAEADGLTWWRVRGGLVRGGVPQTS